MNLICWAYTWMLVNELATKGFLDEHPHINSATVCPPCGPVHDSSEGESLYLTVYLLRGPGHDSTVGE